MSLFMRNLPIVTGTLGATAVVAGAYGSHGLRGKLDDKGIVIWKTAVHYHLTHTLALLALTFSGAATATKAGTVAAHLFTFGILGFSFGIYTTSFLTPGSKLRKFIGPLTPLGGLTLIAAWISLAFTGKTVGA